MFRCRRSAVVQCTVDCIALHCIVLCCVVLCCVDVDECGGGGAVLCPGDEVCRNTPGSYECVCADGYRKQATKCVGQFNIIIIISALPQRQGVFYLEGGGLIPPTFVQHPPCFIT